ncbi:MAG: SycD/LcrH family type III secretion system chaperone, partial [Chlamydiota bacterium]
DKMVKNLEPIVEPEELKVIKDCCMQSKDKLQNYLDKFCPPEEQLEEKAEEYVESSFPDLDDESKKRMKNAFIRDYQGNGTVAEVMGISEESLNTAYTLAHNSYVSGKYPEAKNYFQLLVFWHDKNPIFRFGYAAALHMMKDYKLALDQYLACISLDFKNPIPWFHLADCSIHLKDWKLAIYALNAVIEFSKDKDDFNEIVNKAKLLKDVAQKESEQFKMDLKESASVNE